MPGVRFLRIKGADMCVVKRALLSGVGAALILFAPVSALAYECPPKPPNQTAEQVRTAFLKEVEEADVIFSGEVVESDPLYARFKVDKVWKGELQGEVVILTGVKRHENGSYSRWSSDYGGYRLGEKYVVWASGPAGELKAHACSRTGPASRAAQDIEALDDLKESGSEHLKPSLQPRPAAPGKGEI
jgi:hypothetical protein